MRIKVVHFDHQHKFENALNLMNLEAGVYPPDFYKSIEQIV